RMLRSESNPFVRRQMRMALEFIGTPQAKWAAAYDGMKESAVHYAPAVAVITFLSVLLVRSGWGVLLAYLFSALPLIEFGFENDGSMVLMMFAAPVFSLAGAITGFLFARR